MWLEKRIVVPTDFSEPAMAAANVALDLARQFHLPLVLVHVYGAPGSSYPGVDLDLTADFLRSVESAARAALNREADRLAHKGVDISTVLTEGAAWERILETSKMLEAGMIVVGTHGRRGVPRALLGSVVERIVRFSRIPVLTVRNVSSPAAEA